MVSPGLPGVEVSGQAGGSDYREVGAKLAELDEVSRHQSRLFDEGHLVELRANVGGTNVNKCLPPQRAHLRVELSEHVRRRDKQHLASVGSSD